MKQTVDLFPAHLRHEPVLLGALHALYGCAVLLTLLLGFAVLAELRAEGVRDEVGALRTDVERQRAALAELERTHPAIALDEVLASETAALELERDAKTNILALIASNQLGNRGGFSSHLEALARHPVPGIWLDKIEITGGGRDVSLYGATVEGARVPRLLRALGEAETFAGRSFHTLRMERDAGQPGQVRFALSATPGEATGEGQ